MISKKIYFGLKTIIIIGWIVVFIFNIHIINTLKQDYKDDPANFVFFNSEQHREAYRASINYRMAYNTGWIDDASLVSECRPVVYLYNFYFNHIDRMVKFTILLILLTLLIKIPWNDWKTFRERLKRAGE